MAAKKRKPAIQKPEGFIDDAARAAGKFIARGAKQGAKKANPKNSYTFGKKVVHGSKTQGLKKIEPRKGSATRPSETVNFSWNPKAFGDKRQIVEYAGEYGSGGSYYVGKVPRSAIVNKVPKKSKVTGWANARESGYVIADRPIKVKKEIKSGSKNVGKQIEKAVDKKAVVKRKAKEVKGKVVTSKRKQTYKRSSRNSPV